MPHSSASQQVAERHVQPVVLAGPRPDGQKPWRCAFQTGNQPRRGDCGGGSAKTAPQRSTPGPRYSHRQPGLADLEPESAAGATPVGYRAGSMPVPDGQKPEAALPRRAGGHALRLRRAARFTRRPGARKPGKVVGAALELRFTRKRLKLKTACSPCSTGSASHRRLQAPMPQSMHTPPADRALGPYRKASVMKWRRRASSISGASSCFLGDVRGIALKQVRCPASAIACDGTYRPALVLCRRADTARSPPCRLPR